MVGRPFTKSAICSDLISLYISLFFFEDGRAGAIAMLTPSTQVTPGAAARPQEGLAWHPKKVLPEGRCR
jgi:hypothetical protein